MGAPKTQLAAEEAELIQGVCQGDKEAFYSLVRPCERAIYTAAITILDNPQDAEEVAQEAVLKAFSNLAQFRGEAKFSTWLIQITINEARLKLRKDRRHLYESVDEQGADEEGEYFPKDFADWHDVPSEALQRKELEGSIEARDWRLSSDISRSTHSSRCPTFEHRRNCSVFGHIRRQREDPSFASSSPNAGCFSARDRRELEHR